MSEPNRGSRRLACWKRLPADNGNDTMDHPASVDLMDAEGRFFGTIPCGETMVTRLAKLRRLVDEDGA